MRTLTVTLTCLLSPTVFALDYPQTSDPQEQAWVARYKQDESRLKSPELFAVPTSTPAWPCTVPEVEQYRLAGLQMAHPELKKDIEKQTRKLLRAQGMSPDSAPVTTYSNVRIVPVKAQCTAGKLSGEIVLVSSYDSLMETRITNATGTTTTRIASQVSQRTERTLDPTKGMLEARTFIRNKTSITSSADNPQLDAMMEKLGQKRHEQPPTLSISYNSPDGSMASFSQFQSKPGSVQLMSTFIIGPTAAKGRHDSYTDQRLLMTMPTREGTPHGEQITYMENFAKKNNLSLDKMSGMENAKEVTINGVDLIETRQCFQNGEIVKITPCPAG